jgi:hypothetical protein
MSRQFICFRRWGEGSNNVQMLHAINVQSREPRLTVNEGSRIGWMTSSEDRACGTGDSIQREKKPCEVAAWFLPLFAKATSVTKG